MFIILASNDRGKVAAVGTATGKVFTSEAAATRMARRLEKNSSWSVSYLVLPVEEANV